MKSLRLFLPAATLALLSGCARQEGSDSASGAPLPPTAVRAATARIESVASLTEVTGSIRPAKRAQLAAKLMGAIDEMPVTLGQRVRSGDLLVRISAGEIAARLDQARSQLNLASRDLGRERDLLTKGASTAEMVRGLEDRFNQTRAMVREAEVMLGYASIRAPFDGVVSRKLADTGDLASPGMPILEVEGTADFQVEAAVPDSLAPRLEPGSPLAVEVPAAGLSFTGTLAEISPASDPGAHSALARISVPAGSAVRSGQFARVELPGAPVRALLVPSGAVSTLGQMDRVFVVGDGGRAVLRLVKTGAAHAGRIEILAGLDDGDRVVVAPPPGLREGQPLEVRP